MFYNVYIFKNVNSFCFLYEKTFFINIYLTIFMKFHRKMDVIAFRINLIAINDHLHFHHFF